MNVTLASWIMQVLLMIHPPEKMERSWKETTSEITARYQLIANDLSEVIEAESSKTNPETSHLDNPIFEGDYGKFQTAALMLSIAYYESNFHKLVDNGKWKGDNGKSWCLMQVNLNNGNVYIGSPEMKKWTGNDLVNDHKKCFKAGLAIIKQSINDCSKKGFVGFDLLSEYTTGHCMKNEPYATRRWNMGEMLLNQIKVKNNNSTVNSFNNNKCNK